jgi:RHS repeat-associated protein
VIGRAGLLSVLVLLLPLVAAADTHPNTDRGFSPERSFMVGDVDNVNLFNGNLVLTIPLGSSYPVGGGLSFGLTLVYNSNLWDFQAEDDIVTGTTYNHALPQQTANAGLGWTVSLGRLSPPFSPPINDSEFWVYAASDGSEHTFYPTLHAGDADEPGDTPTNQSVLYSRDGSYLRLKRADREVESPDGTIHKFDPGTGRLVQVRDRFGNQINVSYATAGQWVITDTRSRTYRVHFQSRTYNGSNVDMVQSVELPVFGGGTTFYTFGYTQATIPRAWPHNDPSVGPTTTIQLLTSLTLPDGSSYQMPLADYTTEACMDTACRKSGVIRGLRLPTLGRLEWTWQDYVFPSHAKRAWRRRSAGVATRKTKDAAGSVLGTWTYATSLAAANDELVNTVTDPNGHQTVRYFSVLEDFDYSLPISPKTAADAAGRRLSTQVYSGGTLAHSTWVLYEKDQKPSPQLADLQDKINLNRRPGAERTVFHDDSEITADVTRSGFDGLGHYRTESTAGTFGAGDARSGTANYNPARGTYAIDQATNAPAPGHTFTMLPSSSPWILETYSSMAATEGGTTATTLYCFNAATGFLERKRTLKAAAEGANDVLAVYAPDAAGNVAQERFFGGDKQSLTANGTTCAMALPTPAYQIDHAWQNGALATSAYLNGGFNSRQQTIDPVGLPSQSKDASDLITDYEYDALGRLTWSKPQSGHGGWTEYVYSRATSASSLAKVEVRRRGNGSKTAAILARSEILFDSFGRVWKERQLLPGSVWTTRETLYNGAGQKASVSEVEAGNPTKRTQFLEYEAFGRPKRIRPADGSTHDVTFDYFGARTVERKVPVGTSFNATTGTVSESVATTTETYDRQGRLWKVTEPSGAGDAPVTTTYTYDVGNRLKQVFTTAGVVQTRTFNYDNRGFLTSEIHPEKGVSGNGAVSYFDYDARGHAGRKVDGPNDLTFTYDAAERLTQVKETGSSGRLLKSFAYASAFSPGDWRKGKLREATRYNYVLDGAFSVEVKETYVYGGRDGRVSQRDTAVTVNGGAAESFTQSFAYNPLGLESSITYPVCTHAGCQDAPQVFGDVSLGHPARREIEAIYPDVTSGCSSNPLLYCPDGNVTRREMAVFLIRAIEGPSYQPPACVTPSFADVPCGDWGAPWIEEIFRRGFTAGCALSPRRYCPDSLVSNAQMMVFLLQAREGLGYTPPVCVTPPFPDVPCSYWASPSVGEAARRGITAGCAAGFCPESSITRATMAGYLVRTFGYPVDVHPQTARIVQPTYTQGLLTEVPGYGTVSYHPNLLVSQVVHENDMTETQANDPNAMRRPASISAAGASAHWTTGTYSYDGAGNVTKIGASWFTYDKVSRLRNATLFLGETGGGTQVQQSYTIDPFGNITTISGTSGRNTPTSASTNRLTGAGVAYDAAGNLTSWNGATYVYDRFNQMIRMSSGSEDLVYVYTAGDERIWSYDVPRNQSRWTLRDLGGKVLREYFNDGTWTVETDYLYRDAQLLAAETRYGRRHYHVDHLGTPRLITNGVGYPVAYHVYYPFGEEATAFNQDRERMKFTGHERDLANLAGAGDDLDYMHARHCSPVTGRFLSVDPAGESFDPMAPQSWNRYSYVQGNPLKFVDPSGEVLVFSGTPEQYRQLEAIANAALHGYKLVIDAQGNATLQKVSASGRVTREQVALAAAFSLAINDKRSVNIDLVSGDTGVRFGSYHYQKIDIQDVARVGAGPGVNSAAILAHEVVEQTAKQFFGLKNPDVKYNDYLTAHSFGVAAQEQVSGFTREKTQNNVNPLTGDGTTFARQTQGNRQITVKIYWQNNNLVRVVRR